MRQLLNITAGIIIGLLPLIGALVVGLLIYNSTPNSMGIIIIGALGIVAVWLGYRIFKRIQIVGVVEFITAVHATPELDNLELTKDSETKNREPEEFVSLVNSKENLFKGGTFRIFGDWFGKPYSNYHEIESAHYDKDLNMLSLNFTAGEILEIYNPKQILETSTFLKVIASDRISLTWFYSGKEKQNGSQYFLDYSLKKNKIHTETNVDWYKPIFDVSLGAPSLMIYG